MMENNRKTCALFSFLPRSMGVKGCILAALYICQFLSSGCNKFFDVRPSTSVTNPTTLRDFQEMLNSDSLALCNFTLADFMSDDVRLDDGHLASDGMSAYTRSYLWADAVWQPGADDFMYNSAYARILQMNIILDRVGRASGPEQEKSVVRAQAQINRAWYYLQLAGIYGKNYLSPAAATDLAVPLVLAPDADVLPARATVQQVYDRVLQDLTAAAATPALPDMGQDVVHPGKAAAYALLARAYLNMGRYPDALNAAQSALAINGKLRKHGPDYAAPQSLLDLAGNPETLLARLCVDYDFFRIRYMPAYGSPSLLATLDSNDTRLMNVFGSGMYLPGSSGNAMAFNYSLGVPEVMLIKAECLARQQDVAGALAIVNTLRENRQFEYDPVTGSTDALATVLEERRRELYFRGGLRLTDLKRLNNEGRFVQTPERTADDGATVIATLPVNSPRYLMPFSPVIIANNPSIIQNPR